MVVTLFEWVSNGDFVQFLKGLAPGKQLLVVFLLCTIFKMFYERRSSVYFREDWWVGDKSLRDLFPRLKLHIVDGILPSRDHMSSFSISLSRSYGILIERF